MSISPAQNSSPATSQEPLESLLEMIRRAQTLAEAESFEPRWVDSGDGDPLTGLRQTMAAEAAHQSQTAPSQWYPEADTRTAESDGGAAPDPRAPAATTAPPRASAEEGVEARVGREVLAILRQQPLSGDARAAAIERLATQIDNPDASALRDVLAILVTGQSQ